MRFVSSWRELLGLLVGVAALLPSCARPPQDPQLGGASSAPALVSRYRAIVLDGIPHVRQRPDFGGEACAEMALRRFGRSTDQDAVFNASGLDPALGRGLTARELHRALDRFGFRVGDVLYRVDGGAAGAGLEAQFAALYADLVRGFPSIVSLRGDDGPIPTEQFQLVVGYDAATDELIHHDPALDHGAYQRTARSAFLRRWPLPYEDDAWTIVRLRLEPGILSDPPAPLGSTSPAALVQHVMTLRDRAPAGFSVVVEPPFVVLGDEPPEMVKRRAEHTVKWAKKRLMQDFFDAEPSSVVEVWLFKDRPSYEQNTLALFGERPSTPYGYYSSAHRALIMNIGTGGGTLVHELVHSLVEADFPDCPPWLNEGLGALFEQSADEAGHIVGLTNWRLRGLQRAIREDAVPSFEALIGADASRFYDEDPGTNYGQARYLCFYLQERGLLIHFYRELRDSVGADPTGFDTLKRVLGETDMAAFKARWESYVLGLTVP
jgi:hypothetical protein